MSDHLEASGHIAHLICLQKIYKTAYLRGFRHDYRDIGNDQCLKTVNRSKIGFLSAFAVTGDTVRSHLFMDHVVGESDSAGDIRLIWCSVVSLSITNVFLKCCATVRSFQICSLPSSEQATRDSAINSVTILNGVPLAEMLSQIKDTQHRPVIEVLKCASSVS